ncbi:hypothetical protein [Lysinibacter sp. HNR]|uniref:hypothetical protein n=1 Tax=Lysinibacter sp. HNR TaxID=3031408 RepID=UPI002434E02C|nr:hypothetical protein [Lysinibacter sp. HNR]WGD37658.1 hypothetical protein FrondiHNR_01710 [Lysinibacter sp. HNR]
MAPRDITGHLREPDPLGVGVLAGTVTGALTATYPALVAASAIPRTPFEDKS